MFTCVQSVMPIKCTLKVHFGPQYWHDKSAGNKNQLPISSNAYDKLPTPTKYEQYCLKGAVSMVGNNKSIYVYNTYRLGFERAVIKTCCRRPRRYSFHNAGC